MIIKNKKHGWWWVYRLAASQSKIMFRKYWARFLSLAQSKLGLCSANHRPGYWSNLPCVWPSTAWAYFEQETENGPWLTDDDFIWIFSVGQGVVWLKFGELSKIISWKYTMPAITFMARISSWNFVHVPKAWFWAHEQSFSLKCS